MTETADLLPTTVPDQEPEQQQKVLDASASPDRNWIEDEQEDKPDYSG